MLSMLPRTTCSVVGSPLVYMREATKEIHWAANGLVDRLRRQPPNPLEDRVENVECLDALATRSFQGALE